MTDRNVQEQDTIDNSGSDPVVDDKVKETDKGLATSTTSCSGTDAGCGSDPGTSDTGKIDKGI